MGGSTTVNPPAPPPPAPSPLETSGQAIQAQINALPQILQAQQEFGPQFSETQLSQLQQFGPQFAQAGLDLSQQFGGQFAEQVRAEQEILAPERVAGSREITDFLNAGPEGLTPEDQAQIEESARSARSVRGLAESGFAAEEEIANLFGARQGLRSRFLNTALSASGRLPVSQQGQTVQGQGTTGQLVQNVTPNNIFGAQASANQLAGSIFNTQGGIFGSQLSNQSSSPFGQIAGGLAGGLIGTVTGPGGKLGGLLTS